LEQGRELELAHVRTAVLMNDEGESVGNFDMQSEDDVAEMKSLMAEDEDLQFTTMENYIDIRAGDRLARLKLKAATVSGGSAGFPVTTINRYNQVANATLSLSTGLDHITSIIESDPQAFSVGNKAMAGAGRIATQGVSLATQAGNRDFNDSLIDGKLSKANITDARVKSAVIDLAYAIATSREGGRLTDQDVERAIETIGVGNPDPRAITEVLLDVTTKTRDNWKDRLTVSGLTGHQPSATSHALVLDRLNDTVNRLDTLKGGYSSNPPSAAPTTTSAPGVLAPADGEVDAESRLNSVELSVLGLPPANQLTGNL
jgi:hypothetical protein